jgi:hypothetical protein
VTIRPSAPVTSLLAEDADIEDLFPVPFYVELVKGVATMIPEKGIYAAIKEEGLPPTDEEPRITKRIDRALDGYGQARLDHLPPAVYFERHQNELLGSLGEDTLKRAAELFERLNNQLTS